TESGGGSGAGAGGVIPRTNFFPTVGSARPRSRSFSGSQNTTTEVPLPVQRSRNLDKQQMPTATEVRRSLSPIIASLLVARLVEILELTSRNGAGKNGGGKSFRELGTKNGKALRVNALWPVKNVLYNSSTELKGRAMSEFFEGLDPEHCDQAFNISRNVAESEWGVALIHTEIEEDVGLEAHAANALKSTNDNVVLQLRPSDLEPPVTPLSSETDSEIQFQVVEYVQQIATTVILSGGSRCSPPILEGSGIGNATYFTSLGIDNIVDVPGVGESSSIGTLVVMQWQLNASIPCPGDPFLLNGMFYVSIPLYSHENSISRIPANRSWRWKSLTLESLLLDATLENLQTAL
ncbi:hypothetical protein H0H92_015738, partial [Tricholoma furcatifolium]